MSSDEFQELLSALAATPVSLIRLLNNISDEQLRSRPSEDEFSCVENVCHLRDLEVEGHTPRIDRILAEERPSLPNIDGARLAIERDYNHQNVNRALTSFMLARKNNLRTLTDLKPDQLNREGTLEGVGTVTLESLLLMIRDHDQGHLEDLQRIMRPWKS